MIKNWIFFVSRRFSNVDRKGKTKINTKLQVLGICFGVMTLITVMSIMNGFQHSFIDAILELSSCHLRITDVNEENEKELEAFLDSVSFIKNRTEFYEAQTVLVSENGEQVPSVIRSISKDVYNTDSGFRKELNLVSGSFDLESPGSIILGSVQARNLGVTLGEKVNLFILSGSSDVSFFSDSREYTVKGIFSSGYTEINSSLCFISEEDGKKEFGSAAKKIYGLKLKNSNQDIHCISYLKKNCPFTINVSSWRSYNKSFYGALKIEKDMLMLLVALIFIVVGVNIYNGMRRLVFERQTEMAVLNSFGARTKDIKLVFILKGLIVGVTGSVLGLALGLLISFHTDIFFNAISFVMYKLQYGFTYIFNRQNLVFVRENSSYSLYASIPARVFPSEVIFITLFGIISPLIACFFASLDVLKMSISEVLHYE